MAISPRWVGSSISTPKEHGPSPVGRQRHYGALELAGAGEQVNVNDIVEIEDVVNMETGGSEQHLKNNRPLLAQVLCMWEDTFTGAFRFRGRCLVYASDLPKDALARLQEARRAFPDEKTADDDVHRCLQEKDGEFQPINGAEGFEVDEVFLTADREDIDVLRIVKPVTLSLGSAPAGSPAAWKGKRGPRLTHSFDASSGDFTPVERTDAIAKRARARHAEAAVRASRHAQETAATTSGKPFGQSSGWLLPRRIATAAAIEGAAPAEPGSDSTAISAGDSESEEIRRYRSGPAEKALKPDDMEWEKGEGESNGDSDSDSDPAQTKYQGLENPDTHPPAARTSSRLRKPRVEEDDPGIDHLPTQPRPLPSSSYPLVTPLVTPPTEGAPVVLRDTTIKHQEPIRKRPRRLAMPPIREDPRAVTLVGTRQSKRRPSIAAKRGRLSRGTMEGEEQRDPPPCRSLIGDDHQADIPDLLSAKDRNNAAVPPAPGTGAKMVWRSIRYWDPQSRGMLMAYFDAAKEMVRIKQARPGVAVHIRLGGSKTCRNESDNQRNGEASETGLAGSYAVWAVTNGSSPGGDIRVACSEMAQTEIPASAIQRVQSEEEALAALVKARCTLDAFEPALKVLDEELPHSIETWTLSQVRSLEQALEKDFDPNRRLHGWAREGMSMDRDDFIDLAHVSKQVPGKTSSQVLSFYYRYLAAAEPLTDVVYGTEATKARKLEATLPAGGTVVPPRPDSAKLSPAARLERAGWRTINPAPPNGKVVTGDHSAKPAKPAKPRTPAASPQPSSSMTTRPRIEGKDRHQTENTVPRPARCTTLLTPTAAAPGISRESAAPVDMDHPVANSDVSHEYKRRRAVVTGSHVSRNVPVDIDMVQAKDFGDGARGGGALRRPSFNGIPGSTAPRAPHTTSEAHALHPRPRVVATIGSAPASHGYRTEAAVPGRVGPSRQYHPVPHNLGRVRSEQVDDDGRDRRLIVDGRGVGGGYSRNTVREQGHSEGGSQPEDELGFMVPCWRLLEMAKNYLDQDQLLYMRGLIVTHVRKPMTRHQLLERADSCLQDQQEVLAAFAKMFDRVDHARAEAQLVPLYHVVKRARAAQAEPVSMVSQHERLPPAMVVHANPLGRASHSSFSQLSTVHHAYEAPHYGRAGGGHNGGDAFPRAAPGSFSREAETAIDSRQQRPVMANRSTRWWGEAGSTRTAPLVRDVTGQRLSPDARDALTRHAMMPRDHGQDRDFDVQGEVMRAWSEHQHQHGPGQWQPGNSSSSYAAAAIPADVRPRVPWRPGR